MSGLVENESSFIVSTFSFSIRLAPVVQSLVIVPLICCASISILKEYKQQETRDFAISDGSKLTFLIGFCG